MKKDSIHHIKTGGTIGGCVPEYPEIELLAGTFPDMVNLDKFLTKSLKIYADYSETVVCHKDSREITDADRARIIEAIGGQYVLGIRKFLVTHGTYTMPETGQYIINNLPQNIKDTTQIIITGSMFPWAVLGSDAPLNLGAALGLLLNTENPTISICMHARLFDPVKVKKDSSKLLFEEI